MRSTTGWSPSTPARTGISVHLSMAVHGWDRPSRTTSPMLTVRVPPRDSRERAGGDFERTRRPALWQEIPNSLNDSTYVAPSASRSGAPDLLAGGGAGRGRIRQGRKHRPDLGLREDMVGGLRGSIEHGHPLRRRIDGT